MPELQLTANLQVDGSHECKRHLAERNHSELLQAAIPAGRGHHRRGGTGGIVTAGTIPRAGGVTPRVSVPTL